MILVLCGTQPHSFSRMLDQVEKLLAFDKEIVIQKGHNTYVSDKINSFDFVPKEELQQLYDRADVILTHAGAGSLIDGIKKSKKIIAFPRLAKYGEHFNDHQLELCSKFKELNFIEVCYENDDLVEVYKRAVSTEFSRWNLSGNIVEIIREYLG